MYKIAVTGEYDSIFGFAALGLDTFPVSDHEEGKKTLERLTLGEYAVIYITESMAAVLEHEIEKYRQAIIPSIILIPGVSNNTGAGISGVKKTVEKAVGSDILFSDN